MVIPKFSSRGDRAGTIGNPRSCGQTGEQNKDQYRQKGGAFEEESYLSVTSAFLIRVKV